MSHPLKGLLLAVALFACLAAAHCDRFYAVSARLPLIAPVDSACLHSTITSLADRGRVVHGTRKQTGKVEFFAYNRAGWENVDQVVHGDSSAFLVAGHARINHGFVRNEQDSIGSALGTFLVGMREACGGRSPPGVRGVTVAGNNPSFEAWSVEGTNRRLSLRWSIDHYVLQLDTLLDRWSPRSQWVEVDHVNLPRPPRGFSIATECARGDSLPAGRVFAAARTSDAAFYTDVLQAWDLDVGRLRIVPGRVQGVRCRNTAWGSAVPTASREAEAAALTFTPAPGSARIYVYGPAHFLGWRAIPSIVIDSQAVGRLGASTFLMVEVGPGRHRVSSPTGGVLSIDATADNAYFIKVHWTKLPWTPRTRMHRMGLAEARTVIPTAQMVRSTWLGTAMREPPDR